MARRSRRGRGLSADLPWDEAIRRVLKGADGALRPSDIAERVVANGYRRTIGATPAATVASHLSVSIRDPSTPYFRISRGLYSLRPRGAEPQVAADPEEGADPAETGALRAFGMYWRRDEVLWIGHGRLMGRQGTGASDVNFAGQVGVYLLHDRERVIYVGRATDALYGRLKAHTVDRLSGRWDRFSWFGLLSVADDGALVDNAVPWSQGVVVETMEALLIESLEPPLNRRRGDNFAAVEFVQAPDPQIERAQRQAFLEEIRKTLNL